MFFLRVRVGFVVLFLVCFLIGGCSLGPRAYLVNSITTQLRAVGLSIESEEDFDPGDVPAQRAVRICIAGDYLEIYEFEVDSKAEFVSQEVYDLMAEARSSQSFLGRSARVKINMLIVGIDENPNAQWIDDALLFME